MTPTPVDESPAGRCVETSEPLPIQADPVEPRETIESSVEVEIPATSGAFEASPEPRRRNGVSSFLEVFRKRRTFLIEPRSQLRAASLVCGVVALLLVALNVSLYHSRASTMAALTAQTPGLESVLETQNRIELTLIALGSFVFLAAVFLLTILETHKTAGAAWIISRKMHELSLGKLNTRLSLRKDDNLGLIEEAFHELADSMRQQALEDARTLSAMADTARQLESPEEAAALASRIHECALARSSLVGSHPQV